MLYKNKINNFFHKVILYIFLNDYIFNKAYFWNSTFYGII